MKTMLKNANPRIPLLLYGAPGIGKTEAVRSHFDYTEVMLASTMVEEDIAGLPYRDDTYDFRTIPAIFRNLHLAADAGKTTCLFLDELDKARRSVADTLLTLVASRKVGAAVLPKSTVIIAAANPPEFGGGDGISDAMRSRFCVVDAQPDIEAWCEWARASYSRQAAHAAIDAVENGSVPLFDMAGEEMQKRITCPRTLAMVLGYLDSSPEIGLGHIEKLCGGLLTANASSRLMLALESSPRDADVVEKSHNVRSKSKLAATKTPIRL